MVQKSPEEWPVINKFSQTTIDDAETFSEKQSKHRHRDFEEVCQASVVPKLQPYGFFFIISSIED